MSSHANVTVTNMQCITLMLSFFIAASVMYEQAMRLSQESHSAPIISRQAQCLLACINALHHVNERYRWIVRPVVDQSFTDELSSPNPQKKRGIDGKEVLHYKIKKQVEVLELDDIKKEYYIVDARLKISKINSEMHIVAHTGEYPMNVSVVAIVKICMCKLISSLFIHFRPIRTYRHFVQHRPVHNGVTFVRRIQNYQNLCARKPDVAVYQTKPTRGSKCLGLADTE